MAQTNYAAILLDMNFGPGKSNGEEGFAWLNQILTIDADVVVVMITAHGGIGVAVEAIKQGATDFVTKPWENERLVATLSTSVKLSESRAQARMLKTQGAVATDLSEAHHTMLGQSLSFQKVQELIDKAAPTDANVLITGENGTGKELAARAIHRQSQRKDSMFIPVDLSALSAEKVEAVLFGDGSLENIGRIQAVKGGTLFLDEVSALSLENQARLTTVLEQGLSHHTPIDLRLIASTHCSTHQLAFDHQFKEDLLFKINTIEIAMPPLRERAEDIMLIAEHYISQ